MTRVHKPISLTRYLIEEQREKGVIKPDLRLLIEVVARACKTIATQINKGDLGGVLGNVGSINVQGQSHQFSSPRDAIRQGIVQDDSP